MRALNRDLLQLQRRAGGDGVHATRRDRSDVLARAADTPHELGERGLRATGLRRKHVNALVAEWQRRGLAAGTIKNRTAHIRRWAKRVDPPGRGARQRRTRDPDSARVPAAQGEG